MTYSWIVKIVKIMKLKKAATKRYRLNISDFIFVMLLSNFALRNHIVLQQSKYSI